MRVYCLLAIAFYLHLRWIFSPSMCSMSHASPKWQHGGHDEANAHIRGVCRATRQGRGSDLGVLRQADPSPSISMHLFHDRLSRSRQGIANVPARMLLDRAIAGHTRGEDLVVRCTHIHPLSLCSVLSERTLVASRHLFPSSTSPLRRPSTFGPGPTPLSTRRPIFFIGYAS
jgi:hypothetical protein